MFKKMLVLLGVSLQDCASAIMIM